MSGRSDIELVQSVCRPALQAAGAATDTAAETD